MNGTDAPMHEKEIQLLFCLHPDEMICYFKGQGVSDKRTCWDETNECLF